MVCGGRGNELLGRLAGLPKKHAVRRISTELEVAGTTHQGDTWDLHRGCCSGERVRFGDAVPARAIISSRDFILNDGG